MIRVMMMMMMIESLGLFGEGGGERTSCKKKEKKDWV